MNLSTLRQTVEYFMRPPHRRGACGILADTPFRRMVRKERERADRNGGSFAVVAFDMGPEGSRNGVPGKLARILADNVRFTDEVGWLSRVSIGTLLPDTGSDGASSGEGSFRCLMVLLKSTFSIMTPSPS